MFIIKKTVQSAYIPDLVSFFLLLVGRNMETCIGPTTYNILVIKDKKIKRTDNNLIILIINF